MFSSDIFLLIVIFIFLFVICRLIFSVQNINYLSNKILLAIFIVLGFGFCRYFVINRVQDFYDFQFPPVVVTNSSVLLTIPFLFYLYVRTVIFNQKYFVKSDLIHLFVFVFISFIYEFPFPQKIYTDLNITKDSTLSRSIKDYIFWSNYFGAHHFPDWVSSVRTLLNFVYSILTYRLLYKIFKVNILSKYKLKIKSWLFTLTHLKFAMTFLNAIFTILFIFYGKKNTFSAEIAVLIVSLVFLGLALFLNNNRDILYNIPVYMNPNNLNTLNIIDRIDLKELFNDFNHKIKSEELFLNKDFNLSWLSTTLSIKSKHISLAISENGFENFSEYSNYFRIQKSKELIKKGYLETFSIEALSLASGFKAVNSFYRIFKESTNQTPSKYSEKFK